MAFLEDVLPPSRENWELLLFYFKFMPLFGLGLLFVNWTPMGKTSPFHRFTVPGKLAWTLMEVPGFMVLLYVMWTLPPKLGIKQLPRTNWLMAALFTAHYIYRAILAPILNPSMQPIHPLVMFSAATFQVVNGASIGGWLAGYGPTTHEYWAERTIYVQVGVVIFSLGLLGNMYHDDHLRELRRASAREQLEANEKAKEGGKETNVNRVYKIPHAGLFRYIFYPHYLCEWVEWTGYWIIGGRLCVPAQTFVLNEVSVMVPQALSGRKWYVEKFGDKLADRKAILPKLI